MVHESVCAVLLPACVGAIRYFVGSGKERAREIPFFVRVLSRWSYESSSAGDGREWGNRASDYEQSNSCLCFNFHSADAGRVELCADGNTS